MKVTLDDVAKKAGVTISTVQRALSGGGGVSEVKRAEIQKIAMDMGYRKGMYISSVNKSFFRIAIVFPDQSASNRFYGHYLWAGIHQYLNETKFPLIEMIPLSYRSSPEHQCAFLQEILDGKYGKIDGIVTRGANFPQILRLFEEIENRKIALVLAGIDTELKHRLCCVRSYEKIAGSLAADLFLNFGILEKKSTIILCGKFSGLNQFNNAQGFERQIWTSDITPDIVKISAEGEPDETLVDIETAIRKNESVGAIYACSTQSTLCAYEAVKKTGKEGKIKIVGSDLFEESVQLLRTNKLSAIIHNRPVTVAYRAVQTLVQYLMDQSVLPEDTIFIVSAVVMRGNLDYYLKDIPALNKHTFTEYLE